MNELEDSGSAEMLTDISRGIDKWLWLVETHQQGLSVRTHASLTARPSKEKAPQLNSREA